MSETNVKRKLHDLYFKVYSMSFQKKLIAFCYLLRVNHLYDMS